MKKITDSLKMYFGLILVSSVCSYIYILLPLGATVLEKDKPFLGPSAALVNALMVLFFYGGIGFLGVVLSRKNGFKEIVNNEIKNIKNILEIISAGIGVGLISIAVDILSNKFFKPPLFVFVHPPFPASLFTSINAGISEEVRYRLFFVSFWVWIFSKIIKTEKGRNILFWIIGTFSAILFALAHAKPGFVITWEGIFINVFLSIIALYYFKKYGFLGAVLMHTSMDIIWHVLWGTIQQKI